MENYLINSSTFENINWLQDQLEEQEDLLRLRVDYILRKICNKFGGKLDDWWILGMYEGTRLLDCIGEEFFRWYSVECIKHPTQSPVVSISQKQINLFSQFPTRWLTENFEEELDNLIKNEKSVNK